jgi:hypothetical protein
MAVGPKQYAVVYDRNGHERAVRTGGTRACQTNGCLGTRIFVRWPDGRISEPCSTRLAQRRDGAWQIVN